MKQNLEHLFLLSDRRPATLPAVKTQLWHIAALNQSVPRVSLPHTGRRSLITTIILQASERESEKHMGNRNEMIVHNLSEDCG